MYANNFKVTTLTAHKKWPSKASEKNKKLRLMDAFRPNVRQLRQVILLSILYPCFWKRKPFQAFAVYGLARLRQLESKGVFHNIYSVIIYLLEAVAVCNLQCARGH